MMPLAARLAVGEVQRRDVKVGGTPPLGSNPEQGAMDIRPYVPRGAFLYVPPRTPRVQAYVTRRTQHAVCDTPCVTRRQLTCRMTLLWQLNIDEVRPLTTHVLGFSPAAWAPNAVAPQLGSGGLRKPYTAVLRERTALPAAAFCARPTLSGQSAQRRMTRVDLL